MASPARPSSSNKPNYQIKENTKGTTKDVKAHSLMRKVQQDIPNKRSGSPTPAYIARKVSNQIRRRSFGMKRTFPDKPQSPCNVIGIFGLDSHVIKKDLRNVFSPFGSIKKLCLAYETLWHRARGFAFITYDTVEQATKAKEQCHGLKLLGRKMRIDYCTNAR